MGNQEMGQTLVTQAAVGGRGLSRNHVGINM